MALADDEYSDDERKAALELSHSVGASAAARSLGLNRSSIYRWREMYPTFWSNLTAGEKVGKRKVAERLEELADRYMAAEHDLIAKIEDGQIEPKDAKDAAALLKAMGSSRGAATVGIRQVTGDPDVVEHNINFPALEAAMERLLGGAEPALLPLPVENEAAHEA